jgi:tetratricopeptide (TPR) repeat protein
MVAVVLITILLLAHAGSRGHRHARREADLANIQFSRDRLEEALDARRTADSVATRPRGASADSLSLTRAVTDWAATLKLRLDQFRSRYAPPSEIEDLDLRSSDVVLAIAEGRFQEALGAIGAQAERRGWERLRADALFDTQQWPAALDVYRQILVRHPEELVVLERMAMCLYSLQEMDGAVRAYADLAKRLHDRGSRLLARLDPGSAVQDLNKAVTIGIWLVEQGRSEHVADLARSFSTCAAALIELRKIEIARPYLAQALDLRSQLIAKGGRADLSRELATDQAAYAGVLEQLKEPNEAIRHFETAAEAFAGLGDLDRAVEWQTRAVDLAAGDARRSAQLRLDRYRAGKP